MIIKKDRRPGECAVGESEGVWD